MNPNTQTSPEDQAIDSNSFRFVTETYYMPDIHTFTARKALLRLDTAEMLELLAQPTQGIKYEQIFKVHISKIKKVNTVFAMTYIHIGSKKFRLYDKPITNMANFQDEISDTAVLSLLSGANIEEVIIDNKRLAKKFKQLKVRGFYTGPALVILYTVLAMAMFVAYVGIFEP